MTPPLRERATDRHGVVHEVIRSAWSLLTTACQVFGHWEDRDHISNYTVMTWDALNPMADVTCITCLVKEARR